MKITIVTAVYNRVKCIAEAIDSLQSQTYQDVQHVVVDGASNDGTLSILQKKLNHDACLISEPDRGIYSALNKGLFLAKGEVIGLLHSDDVFADTRVLADVASIFSDPTVDLVYGDLDYVAKDGMGKVIRHWKSGAYSQKSIAWGWMPPHPSLFVRRRLIDLHGFFDESFRIAADYDLMLRYLSAPNIRVVYIPRVLVKMRMGGYSNSSLAQIWIKIREDYRVLRKNRVGGLPSLLWKNIRKIPQFFRGYL
jgi:glycosyltransferase involved in cell wall biosynthesis